LTRPRPIKPIKNYQQSLGGLCTAEGPWQKSYGMATQPGHRKPTIQLAASEEGFRSAAPRGRGPRGQGLCCSRAPSLRAQAGVKPVPDSVWQEGGRENLNLQLSTLRAITHYVVSTASNTAAITIIIYKRLHVPIWAQTARAMKVRDRSGDIYQTTTRT